MIASVTGQVTSLAPDGAVLEVGGVGLLVQCNPGALARLRVGSGATLHTSLVVREDALTLYGFPDAEERSIFELLQTASGVGPRLAQAVLAVHAPEAVRRAVASEDLAALTLVPGIGRKGAQRLVLELKDRLGPPEEPAPARVGTAAPWRTQVRAALTGLGYTGREADEALARLGSELAPDTEGEADMAALLRQALTFLRRA